MPRPKKEAARGRAHLRSVLVCNAVPDEFDLTDVDAQPRRLTWPARKDVPVAVLVKGGADLTDMLAHLAFIAANLAQWWPDVEWPRRE
jgi:hypothetical protein